MKTLTENDLKMYLGTGLKGQFNPNEVSSNLQNETRIKELKNTKFSKFYKKKKKNFKKQKL